METKETLEKQQLIDINVYVNKNKVPVPLQVNTKV